MTGTSGGGGGGTSKRRYWGLLVLLALCCSGLYILLYYRVSLASSSALLFPRSFLQHSRSSSSSSPTTSLPPATSHRWRHSGPNVANVSLTSSSGSQTSSGNVTRKESGIPLLTLFSTWVDRPDLSVVRNLTLRNWAQLAPDVTPLLFTNDSKMATQAQAFGWKTLPVSKTAIGVPVLKNMYLDAMDKFNSTLYAFANGDILFTRGLVDSLQAILHDHSLPLDQYPVFVVGQRTNVAMVTPEEALNFENISRAARARGKLFTTMAEDFFITDRRFPWDNIPGVVIGRVAYDNWLVLHAIQSHHVVVDVTKTAPAIHQTTKAGNHEGFTHPNSSYNDNVLKRLYKRIHYMGGCVDCSPWRTLHKSGGKVAVEKRATRPKHC